jgi:hypothetical protein
MQSRTIRIILAGLAASALALTGCSKEKKDEGAATDDTAEATTGDKAGAARPAADQGGAAVSGDIKKALGFLPADSKMVMGLNPGDVMKNAQFKAFLPLIMRQAPAEVTAMKVQCGIDPLTALSGIVVGGNPDADGDDKNMVVVGMGLERSQFESCAKKLATDGTEVKIDGKFTILDRPEGEDDFVSMWPDDTTMVMSPLSAEALDKLPKGLQGNAVITEMLRNVDTSGGLWLVVSDMDDMGDEVNGAFGTLSFADGLKADVGVRMASADLAKQKVAEAQQQMKGMMGQAGKAGEILQNKLTVKSNDKDILVQLNLTADELRSIMPLVQQMGMGMMMGGGGMGGGMPQ